MFKNRRDLSRMFKYDPAQPRGKTVPGTNDGSFAPKNGGVGDVIALQNEARGTDEFLKLEAARKEAENALNAKRKALVEAAREKVKKHLPDLDKATAENMAFHLAMTERDAYKAEQLAATQAFSAAENYVRDFVTERLPAPSPYEDEANQFNPQTQTPEFRKWFGNSAVVDGEGNPLVVFHGTKEDIHAFNTSLTREEQAHNVNWCGDLGTWFAGPAVDSNYDPGNAESVASDFAKEMDGSAVYPVYLAITKPKEYEGYEDFQQDRYRFQTAKELRDELIKKGYNGVVIRGSDTDGNVVRDDWVAFRPGQIKSAIGNKGTFDSMSDDIRKRDLSRLFKYAPDQPRGETVEGTNSGSFAPAGGGKSKDKAKDSAPVAHDDVPKEIVAEIEKIAKSMGGVSDRNEAADIVDALAKKYPEKLAAMIDDLDPSQRPMKLLHAGDEAKGIPTVWLLGWDDNEGTDIHDHKESQVGVHVLRGRVKERVYSSSHESIYDHREDAKEGKGVEIHMAERDLRAGSSIGLNSPYTHEVFGSAKDGTAKDITVHAYFPPLKAMTYYKYDEKAGTLKYDGEWEEGKEPTEEEKQKKRKRDFSRIFKFDPDQPRAPAGVENGGQWVATDVSLVAKLIKDKGFTYQPVTAEFPESGYALSIIRDAEEIIEGEVTAKDLRKYLNKHKEAFKDKGVFVGAWHDDESGKTYLDLSKVVKDEDEARRLSIEHKQEAYFSLHEGKTVYVRARKEETRSGASPTGYERRGFGKGCCDVEWEKTLKLEFDWNKRILEAFVSFETTGDQMMQMVSALHTSRVSAYGFTAEAEAIGITHYEITEQLDDKICDVCEAMHGHVFEVEDARSALEEILHVSDPEDLRVLQSWPRQDEQNVNVMKEMTDDELIDLNWHIPPYHPLCRGLLVPVGKAPSIQNTASYRAAFPEDDESSAYHRSPRVSGNSLAANLGQTTRRKRARK